MTDQDDNTSGRIPPDEESSDSGAEVVPLPGVGDDEGEITSEDYLTATTEEYRDLAAEVSRAAAEEWEQQAVAATLPGVESGLVGFEDMAGGEGPTEEELEVLEQAAASDLLLRVVSGLIIFGLFLGSLLLGGWWFTSFVILVMVLAVGELYATLRSRGYRPLALFGLIGVVMVGVGAQNWGVVSIGGWVAAIALVTILFYSLTTRRNPLENAAVTLLGLAWVGMLAFAILIAKGPHPVSYILFIVVVTALNDIGAYFFGRAVGSRKLAPVVSPNKTVEGFFGGLITGLVAAAVMATFPAWEDIGLTRALITATVIGIVGPLGDLAESAVKRDLGVKDMGSVLPGHGGMIDRIDAFLFVVPAVYVLFRGFGLL